MTSPRWPLLRAAVDDLWVARVEQWLSAALTAATARRPIAAMWWRVPLPTWTETASADPFDQQRLLVGWERLRCGDVADELFFVAQMLRPQHGVPQVSVLAEVEIALRTLVGRLRSTPRGAAPTTLAGDQVSLVCHDPVTHPRRRWPNP